MRNNIKNTTYLPSGFINNVNKIPKLNRENEYQLAIEWRGFQNRQAAHSLILANLYIVLAISREFKHFNVDRMDLIQEGSIGLMKAVKKYDPEKGFRMSTYASFWVRAEMHDFIIKTWSIVKLGTTKAQLSVFAGLRHSKELLAATEGRNIDEVAKKYNLTANKYKSIAARFLTSDKSTDVMYENGILFSDTISSGEQSFEDSISQNEVRNLQNIAISEAIKLLDERERKIIIERYLSDSPKTLLELSDMFSVSIGMIAKIEKRAKNKMAQNSKIKNIAFLQKY